MLKFHKINVVTEYVHDKNKIINNFFKLLKEVFLKYRNLKKNFSIFRARARAII